MLRRSVIISPVRAPAFWPHVGSSLKEYTRSGSWTDVVKDDYKQAQSALNLDFF